MHVTFSAVTRSLEFKPCISLEEREKERQRRELKSNVFTLCVSLDRKCLATLVESESSEMGSNSFEHNV